MDQSFFVGDNICLLHNMTAVTDLHPICHKYVSMDGSTSLSAGWKTSMAGVWGNIFGGAHCRCIQILMNIQIYGDIIQLFPASREKECLEKYLVGTEKKIKYRMNNFKMAQKILFSHI